MNRFEYVVIFIFYVYYKLQRSLNWELIQEALLRLLWWRVSPIGYAFYGLDGYFALDFNLILDIVKCPIRQQDNTILPKPKYWIIFLHRCREQDLLLMSIDNSIVGTGLLDLLNQCIITFAMTHICECIILHI